MNNYRVSDGTNSEIITAGSPEAAVDKYFDGYDWADGDSRQPYTVYDVDGDVVLRGTRSAE